MKKLLNSEGLEVSTPKQVIREAGNAKIIDDVKLWIEFVNKRNLTVHTYNELVLKEIMEIMPKFKDKLSKLIKELENRVK